MGARIPDWVVYGCWKPRENVIGCKPVNGLLPLGTVVIDFWLNDRFSYVHDGDVAVLQWR